MGINCQKDFWLHHFPGALTKMSPREIIYLIHSLTKKNNNNDNNNKKDKTSQVPQMYPTVS